MHWLKNRAILFQSAIHTCRNQHSSTLCSGHNWPLPIHIFNGSIFDWPAAGLSSVTQNPCILLRLDSYKWLNLMASIENKHFSKCMWVWTYWLSRWMLNWTVTALTGISFSDSWGHAANIKQVTMANMVQLTICCNVMPLLLYNYGNTMTAK